MERFVYRGEKTQQISFPLGGIGSGCIGLSGSGRLIDWEIFNKPNKNSVNGFSHFAVKAEADGAVLDARVLNGDYSPPHTGDYRIVPSGFGFGPRRESMAGFPHFREVIFRGEFPIAELDFVEEKFPGKVKLTAFNPFIPMNERDSSIPAAFFEFSVENPTDNEITYTFAGTLQNPFDYEKGINRFSSEDASAFMQAASKDISSDSTAFGDICIATDSADVSFQEYWFRGNFFDNVAVYWDDFTQPGKLINRRGTAESKTKSKDHCTISASIKVAPGKTGKARFVISWNFPNCRVNWKKCDSSNCCSQEKCQWKNYYASLFKDSVASARYCLTNWNHLYDQTRRFKDILFASTLPEEVLDAISANISILKTPTCLRLEDGTFYGFEGCCTNAGCCEGSCTHVWNYQYALPFLFPALERSMRDTDYKYNLNPSGKMSFRLQLPLGSKPLEIRACADGQFGGVIKTYRDWKVSGDCEWLKGIWPAVKKSLEYAWSDDNPDRWDPDKNGVLTGRQHHTLDVELFGPNSWLTGFYLVALQAGAEMAASLGEQEAAAQYREIVDKGKSWIEKNLFNGEYYYQKIDLSNRSIVDAFGAREDYWDEEHSQIKYQIAEGCGIDQVIAQWHANLCGLGKIFDKAHVRSALKSIYKYNFISMRDFVNPCRLFVLDDEKGVIICSWPREDDRPVIGVLYAQETMYGFEYQAACHMIQEGMIEEGLEIVRTIRERFDGYKRNPWNEYECGSNYARSMASYALLLTFSGFEYDLVNGRIGFNPLMMDGGFFRTFWSVGEGWGEFEVSSNTVRFEVVAGQIELATLSLPFLEGKKITDVTLNGNSIKYMYEGKCIIYPEPVTLQKNQTLEIHLVSR